jgi:hypothetical protein
VALINDHSSLTSSHGVYELIGSAAFCSYLFLSLYKNEENLKKSSAQTS